MRETATSHALIEIVTTYFQSVGKCRAGAYEDPEQIAELKFGKEMFPKPAGIKGLVVLPCVALND
jgi:hypothetical protein